MPPPGWFGGAGVVPGCASGLFGLYPEGKDQPDGGTAGSSATSCLELCQAWPGSSGAGWLVPPVRA